MSLSRKDIQKRKERENAVRKKVLDRREEIRKERKLVEDERKKDKEMFLLEHGHIPAALPGNPELAEAKKAEREKKVSEKLKRNLAILKNLEQEYEQEQAARTNLNSQLEEEGYHSMKEKMDALHAKALKMQKVVEDLDEAASKSGKTEDSLQQK
jgi:hypothetical protein